MVCLPRDKHGPSFRTRKRIGENEGSVYTPKGSDVSFGKNDGVTEGVLQDKGNGNTVCRRKFFYWCFAWKNFTGKLNS